MSPANVLGPLDLLKVTSFVGISDEIHTGALLFIGRLR